MSKILITGAAGLVGSEAARRFATQGHKVYGIDNDMRAQFFGTSTKHIERALDARFVNFFPLKMDIRNRAGLESIFEQHGPFDLICHCAAQPAHEYATRDSILDFEVNAIGTFNLLETFRQKSPDAVFIQVSTSKVYGDHVNRLPLVEYETRYDLPSDHLCYAGTDETMSVEGSLHSLFGASKLAGDVMAQEYGRYLGLKVAIFRPVCVTGPQQQGAPLHGYLAYLVKCIAEGAEYTINGYGGKQVRDNIHAFDLVAAFDEVFQKPEAMKNGIGTYGEVFNIGAGRASNNSILEAMGWAGVFFEKNGAAWAREGVNSFQTRLKYSEETRRGDHRWCIFSTKKFRAAYPRWRVEYDNERLMRELCEAFVARGYETGMITAG